MSCESNSGTKLIPSESHPCIMQIAPNSLIVLLCTLYHRKEEQFLLKLQNYSASYLTSISVCHYVIRFPRISNKVNFFSSTNLYRNVIWYFLILIGRLKPLFYRCTVKYILIWCHDKYIPPALIQEILWTVSRWRASEEDFTGSTLKLGDVKNRPVFVILFRPNLQRIVYW